MLKQHALKVRDLLSQEGISSDKLDGVVRAIDGILKDEGALKLLYFRGFAIDDTVTVSSYPAGKKAVIGYDGIPEGFQEKHLGQHGRIIAFDSKTLSPKNVLLNINGHEVWGNVDNITRTSAIDNDEDHGTFTLVL